MISTTIWTLGKWVRSDFFVHLGKKISTSTGSPWENILISLDIDSLLNLEPRGLRRELSTYWFHCISRQRDIHLHQVALAAEKTCRENVLISLRIWQDRFPSQPEPWRIRSGNGYVLISLHIWRARSPFAPGHPDSRENLLIPLHIRRDRFPSQPGPSRIRSGNRYVLISEGERNLQLRPERPQKTC